MKKNQLPKIIPTTKEILQSNSDAWQNAVITSTDAKALKADYVRILREDYANSFGNKTKIAEIIHSHAARLTHKDLARNELMNQLQQCQAIIKNQDETIESLKNELSNAGKDVATLLNSLENYEYKTKWSIDKYAKEINHYDAQVMLNILSSRDLEVMNRMRTFKNHYYLDIKFVQKTDLIKESGK